MTAPAARARETGLVAALGPPAKGLGDLGVLRVEGADAASFLHVGVTNDVEGLAPGAGNLSARVNKTGRLQFLFSLHRLPDAPAFLLLLERGQVPALLADLDAYLFAEQVSLTDVSEAVRTVVVQGPRAPAVLERALAGTAWATAPEGSVVPLALRDVGPVAGGWVIRRSLTGDPGFAVLAPPGADAVSAALFAAAEAEGLCAPGPEALSDALETLRIEAGVVRVGPDTPGKAPLLPETGLEHQTVSYAKGCYLGQEVIARVRTYGSLPRALRALVFAEAELDALPPVGADLLDAAGARVGRIASRTWSPVRGAVVALAYLERAHRTPGSTLQLSGGLQAEVVLPPLYRAADAAHEVQQLYDSAVRVFAAGDPDAALARLQEALALDPSFADGYETIGVILGKAGRLHEAIDLFRRLEELAPDEPMVNTNLSLYYMKLGDRQTAERESATAMSKSMARGRQESDGRSAAELAAEQEAARRADAQRKREMFSMVLEIDPVDPIALFGLGNALSTLGLWDEADAAYASARAAHPDHSAVYLGHGKVLEQLERPHDAVATYAAGMEVASRRGDLMPLKEMEQRALLLRALLDEPEESP